MTDKNTNKKPSISVLGAGKIGEAIIGTLITSGKWKKEQITATTRKKERADFLAQKHGIETASNPEAVKKADIILICVKPQIAEMVLKEIEPVLNPDQLIISIMAGTTIAQMEEWTRHKTPVIRVMPNTPLRVKKAMTAISGGNGVDKKHYETTSELFSLMGRTRVLDEKYFDAITSLSASGPAFVYIMIESLAEGGVKAGLPRDIATEMAAQACLGAASMVLETGQHPALLKDEVTTPAGCTIDGILKLEEGGIRVTLIKTVMEAAMKAHELGKQK